MNRLTGYRAKSKGIPLRLATGKVVGKLRGTVAVFRVKRSRHFYWKLGGYSLDAGILSELERIGVTMIEFEDVELGKTFRIGLETFMAHAKQCPSYGYGLKVATHQRFYQDDSMDDLLPGMIAPTNAPGLSAQAGA